MLIVEALIVLALVFVNAVFAMSELAVVSARRARLQHLADQGSSGAAAALSLQANPTNFLSTVQVGITLVGIIAGAYGGATFSGPLASLIAPLPLIGHWANPIAFVAVVVVITYLSLIIGELVPKRIALESAEAIACRVAPPMRVLAVVGKPVVWFLSISTDAILRLLGIRGTSRETVTEEEVKALIAEGTESGVFHEAERHMIDGVLRLADRAVRSIMVPRPDIVWIDLDDPTERMLEEIRDSGYSRLPAARGDIDTLEGVVFVKDLVPRMRDEAPLDIAAIVREPLYVSEAMTILALLERFKSSRMHMAVVLDEYGTVQGIATPADVLGAIAGDMPEEADADEGASVQREDGSWLLEGAMQPHEAERLIGVSGIERPDRYATLAGFVIDELGRLPQLGEHVDWNGWRFEVVDLDGHRIDKVLARPLGGSASKTQN